MHLIGNAKLGKNDGASSPKVMVDDTKLVSDDCYTESRGKRLHFIDQSSLVSAITERVVKMS